MASRLGLGGLEPRPGVALRGLVSVPGTDPAWQLPVHVIRGRRDGPTLSITAGIHAAEYAPIQAAIELARGLDPAELAGTVIVVAPVNTPGFAAHSIGTNPVDGRNLNREFPGDPAGSPAQRVAHFLVNELMAGSDAFCDLHAGDLIEALVPFAGYKVTGNPAVDDRSRAMAEASGFEHLVEKESDDVSGNAHDCAALAGVPAVLFEAGQQGIADRASIDRHLAGLHSVLAHLGMVDGDVLGGPRRRYRRFRWLSAPCTGAFHPAVQPGEDVEADQLVGEVWDLLGDERITLRSPAAGTVLFMASTLAVAEGGTIVGVAVP